MLTDEIWLQLQAAMASHGCYDTKNSRDVPLFQGSCRAQSSGCGLEN